VRGRCAIDEGIVYDSAVICKRHVNEWLHRYKPTQCAACPQPLSSSASMACPEWLRQQLGAHHGASLHKRPCYEKALAAKKQQAADTQLIKVEPDNNPPQQAFQLDVCQHTNMCTASHTESSTLTHALSVHR
jgi:hypothetical protein